MTIDLVLTSVVYSVSNFIRTHCIWPPARRIARLGCGMTRKEAVCASLLGIRAECLLLPSVLMVDISLQPVSPLFSMLPRWKLIDRVGIADDCTVKLWDIGSGKMIKSMAGHTSRIHSLAFSMESSVLLSSSSDCTIRMWDVQNTRAPSDQTLSGAELKNLGLSAENFSGLKSASALSLSSSGLAGNGAGLNSATLSVLPKSAFAEEDPNQRCVRLSPALLDRTYSFDACSPDLLGVLLSKRTPLHHVQMTERNLALAVGPMQPM